MKILFDLFWTFAKLGAVAFGGGYAMLPLLEREIVNNKHWATQEEILDYYAIGQCTPGVIAVNVSTFIGYKKGGFPGAFIATFGMIFCPVIIILAIAGVLDTYSSNPYIQRAFEGISICVCVLITDAIIKLWNKSIKNKMGYIIFAIVLILALFTNISSGIFVVCAGIFGIILAKIAEVKK